MVIIFLRNKRIRAKSKQLFDYQSLGCCVWHGGVDSNTLNISTPETISSLFMIFFLQFWSHFWSQRRDSRKCFLDYFLYMERAKINCKLLQIDDKKKSIISINRNIFCNISIYRYHNILYTFSYIDNTRLIGNLYTFSECIQYMVSLQKWNSFEIEYIAKLVWPN